MTEESSSPDALKTIDVHYLKSASFREVSCDGVVGGPTPHGKIWLSFFTERFPLPRIMRQQIKRADGENRVELVGNGEIVEARVGIVRNVEIGVYMNIETAKQLRDWLGRHINELEEGK